MKLAIILSLTFICVLITTSSVPSSAFRSQVCQQCNSWCPVRSVKGPRGRKGKRGVQGVTGTPGRNGSEGEPGIIENSDKEIIVNLINTRIYEVLPGVHKLELAPFRSCRDVKEKLAFNHTVEDGLFNITFDALDEMELYCDFRTDGGNWLVFQRRMDGSVNFYRDWDDYVNGFGNRSGEFWLGLENLYRLTSTRKWEMRIDMVTKEGQRFFVKYWSFRIGPASDNYRLHTLRRFTGNTTDSLSLAHFGQTFSTYDMDHDEHPAINCAKMWHSGWWYRNCLNVHSNLNGKFNSYNYDKVAWYDHSRGEWLYMKFTEMKMRPHL